jgi:hypothetical protein
MLLADAGLLLVAMRVALHTLPWNRALGLIRSPRVWSPSRFRPRCRPSLDQLEWAVRHASRVVPHSCLSQTLALQRLLARAGYPSSIHIGVAKKPDRPFIAHAWIEHNGRPLLDGAGDATQYSRLLRFETCLE